MPRSSTFLRVLFPTIVVFAFLLTIATYLGGFIPVWNTVSGIVMLGLTTLAFTKQLTKLVRLIFGEYVLARKKIHILRVQPLSLRYAVHVPAWRSVLRFAFSLSLVTLVFGGGLFTTLNLQLFQPPLSSCTAPPAPSPKIENFIKMGDSKNPTIGWQSQIIGKATAKFSAVAGYLNKTALHVETIGKNSNGYAGWTYTPHSADSLETYDYADNYKSSAVSALILQYNVNGNKHYKVIDSKIPPAAQWTHYVKTFDVPYVVGNVAISVIHAVTTGNLSIDSALLHPDFQKDEFAEPMISITFDDGWRDQYVNAVPLLCKYKIPGTFYIVDTYLNSFSDYMLPFQVQNLATSGEEIGSHTMTHENLTRDSSDRTNWQLGASKQALEELIDQPITDFAAPFGAVNPTVIGQVSGYYQTQRGSDDGSMNLPREFNPYNIKTYTYDKSISLNQIKSWIRQAIQDKAWIVMTFHQIANQGDPEYNEKWTVDKDTFAQLLSFISSLHIKPVTMHQALTEVYQQV